jgi:prepilin-type N-terminal cleavage/methylation domain-containing protein
MRTTQNKKTSREQGFTLIEMAIVVTVIGLIIASAAPIYKQYRDDRAAKQTTDSVRSVSEAIGSYRATRGRYPCPAPLTARPGDPTYGHEEASCRTAPQSAFINIPVGTCVGGICAQQSLAARAFDLDNNGVVDPATETLRVRIGAVPFRELGLQEESSLDGYRNRIYYVVTEQQAQQSTFEMDRGGIEIVKDDGTTALNPAGSGHFLVYSAGVDSAGAFTYEGTQTACPAAGTAQGENCDFGNTAATIATFSNVQRSDAAGNQKFDDVMSWFTMAGVPQWQVVDDNSSNSNPNIRQIEQGNVGTNTNPGTNLDNANIVDGQIRSTDKAFVNEICDEHGSNCFPPTLVSETDPNNYIEGEKGIKCPDGQFMNQLVSKVAVCIDSQDISFGCTEDHILKGFDANRDPICAPAPSMVACGEQAVTVCTAQTLPASPHNTTVTLTGGSCRTSVYRCDDGTWRNTSNTGRCTFTPTTTYPACGGCFADNQTVTTQCIGANVVDRSNCTCNENVPTCGPTSRSLACTSSTVTNLGFRGLWTGSIPQTRTHSCPTPPTAAAGTWSAWIPTVTDAIVRANCQCAGTVTQHENCPPGHTGTGRDVTYPKVEVNKVCMLDTANPTYNPPTAWPTPTCIYTCTADVEYRDKSCPDGEAPATPQSRTRSCPSNTWSPWSGGTCAPIICTWKQGSFSSIDTFGRAPVGSNCLTCGSSGQCSTGGGGSYNIYDNCQCTGD